MIHEEICTYEVCKFAKEKGFSWHTRHIYDEETKELIECKFVANHNSEDGIISAPTHTLLQRWLREEKHCNIEIAVCPAPISIWIFVWSVSYGADSYYSHRCNYDTYELALEDAELYVLKNLV